MFATDPPKRSPPASPRLAVEELISTVESTEPSVFMNMMCIVLPRCAPTAKSLTPSPSKSPMFATAVPKLSPLNSPRLAVSSLISTVESTEPSDVAANASKSDGG